MRSFTQIWVAMARRLPLSTNLLKKHRRKARQILTLGLTLVIATSTLLNRVQAAAGDLDPGFDSDGRLTANFHGDYDEVKR